MRLEVHNMLLLQLSHIIKTKLEHLRIKESWPQTSSLTSSRALWSEVIMGEPEAGLRLIYHPAQVSSRPDKVMDEVSPNMKVEDKPYYADTFAYMMLSQPSIAGLNQLLSEENVDLEVEHTRFRPNILIEGDFPAFSEDKWPFIRIGDVVMRNVRVCDRFVVCFDTKLGSLLSLSPDVSSPQLIQSSETSTPSRSL